MSIHALESLNGLYHGTDARIVRMSEKERKEYFDKCLLVADYSWTHCEDEILRIIYNSDFEGRLLKNLVYFNHCCRQMKSGDIRYQYDAIYLTPIQSLAQHYAKLSFAGGELGMIAWIYVKAAELLHFKSWNPNESVSEAAEAICQFAQAEAEPVIFGWKTQSFDEKYLKYDNGEEITEEDFDPDYVAFRYEGEMVLDLRNAIHLEPFDWRSILTFQ